MPRSRHIRIAVAALSLTALGMFGSPAAASAPVSDTGRTAGAAECPWDRGAPTSSENPNTTTDHAAVSAPVRKGPYDACDVVQTLPPGTSVTVSCYILISSYTNSWSYIPGSGWIRSTHLRSGGATHLCLL